MNALVSPHQERLLNIYYAYVYPSLPILEDRAKLEAAISSGAVPTSLVASIYCSAMDFGHYQSSALEELAVKAIPRLRDIAFSRMTLETRTPSLQTVQAMLIYMQLHPLYIREPNHPGFWALTCQVGTALYRRLDCWRGTLLIKNLFSW